MSLIDHKAQAQSRVYSQYRNKVNLMAWIAINGDLGNEIEAAYQAIAGSYDIDSANTDELDVLGRIVVISRAFESQVPIESFLFGNAQFGGLATQFKVGQGTTDQELNDDVYRLLIKAKIAKNTNDATLDGIINAFDFIIETTDITIVDPEDMSFLIIFDTLTDLEKLVLVNFDIVPKPQGVRFNGYVEKASIEQFGDAQFGSSQFVYNFGV